MADLKRAPTLIGAVLGLRHLLKHFGGSFALAVCQSCSAFRRAYSEPCSRRGKAARTDHVPRKSDDGPAAVT